MSSKLLAQLLHRKQSVQQATAAAGTATNAKPTTSTVNATKNATNVGKMNGNGQSHKKKHQQPSSSSNSNKPQKHQQQHQQHSTKASVTQHNANGAAPMDISPSSNTNTSASASKKKNKKRKHTASEDDAQSSQQNDTSSTQVTTDQQQPKKKQKHSNTAHAPTSNTPSAASSTPASAAAPPARKLSALQQKMASKLAGARFRWLNEKLYTCTSAEAYEYFQSHPEEFDEYHKGFGVQVKEWPVSPLDQFISYLKERPKLIAGDFGCGEARLAASVTNKVYSFDLVAHNDRVTPCNIAHVPLPDGTLDVAIFCLSLMGVDFMSFIREAHRTLKPNGVLFISEVRSRFEESGIDVFIQAVNAVGFTLKRKELKNQMFATLEFQKSAAAGGGGKGGKNHASAAAVSADASTSSKPNSTASHKKQQQPHGKHPGAAGSQTAKTSFTHPIKKGSTAAAGTDAAPMLTACIYKKR